MSDNRKNTITAKIACQIMDYYKQALKQLESKECAVVGSKRLKVSMRCRPGVIVIIHYKNVQVCSRACKCCGPKNLVSNCQFH